MGENPFGILIDNIFNICGICSHSRWTDKAFQLFFDFPIECFAYPHTKTCRVEAKSDQNVLYHFIDSYKFLTTPTMKWMDGFLKEREETLSNWIMKKWCYDHPKTYLQILLTWMFFKIIRRTFDFNVFPTEEEAKRVEKMYSSQPDKFRFWELITNLISKVWFFKLISELKTEFGEYVRVVGGLIDQKNLDIESSPLMDQILHEIAQHKTNLGLPVYASEGEIVVLRRFEQKEIYRGFLDRTQKWFIVLRDILNEYGYNLTYQYPFGTDIGNFPIEICLSFKSEKFKGNGMPVYFTPKFDELFGDLRLQKQ